MTFRNPQWILLVLSHYRPISLFVGLFANKWPQELNAPEFAAWLKGAIPEFDQEPVLPQLPEKARW